MDNVEGSDGGKARRRQQSLAKRRDAIFSISAHYFYDRWLWIQFPWLALANATGASQKARGGHDLKLMSGVSNTGILSGGTMIRSSSAGAAVSASTGKIIGGAFSKARMPRTPTGSAASAATTATTTT